MGDTGPGAAHRDPEPCVPGERPRCAAPHDRAPAAVPALSITGALLLSVYGQGTTGPAKETTQAAGATVVSDNEDLDLLTQDGPPPREVLLKTTPDLVLSPTTNEFTPEQGFASQEQLSEAGTEAYISTACCPDRRSSAEVTDLLPDMDNLGALLGQSEQARKVKVQAQRELDEVSNAVADLDQPTVAQVYVEAKTLMAIGTGIEYEMIRRAGGDNVFSPDDAAFRDFFAATISPETLVEKNPDAIVFLTANDEQMETTRTYLKKHFPEVKVMALGRFIDIGADQVMPES